MSRTSNRWSKEDVQKLIAMCSEGITKTQAANALGCSPNRVLNKCMELHLSLLRDDEWTPKDIERLEQLCEVGITKSDAAEVLNCSVGRVATKGKQLGLHFMRENSWTDGDIVRLRSLAESSKTVQEIAKELGRTSLAVTAQARKHNICVKSMLDAEEKPERNRSKWTDADDQLLEHLFSERNSVEHLADVLGRSQCAVRNRMCQLGLRHYKKRG